MKPRIWIGVGLGLIALVGGIWIAYDRSAAAEEAEFQHQLKLAKEIGLPPTWQDYKASIRPAAESENAAKLYRSLKGRLDHSSPKWSKVNQVLFSRDAQNVADMEKVLRASGLALAIIDEAVKRPRCWFDRDWSLGMAVQQPEYSYMRGGARLLQLRAAVAAYGGNSLAALLDAQEIFTIARHAGEESQVVAHLTSSAICQIGLQTLAALAYVYRGNPGYLQAMKRAIPDLVRPDLQAVNRELLVMYLQLAEASQTPDGRKEFGLREGEISFVDRLISPQAQRQAKIELVRSIRQYWIALGEPVATRASDLHENSSHILKAFRAFPTAYKIVEPMWEPDDPNEGLEAGWQARRDRLIALSRALEPPKVPRQIVTSDLHSSTGKPLSYSFDGKQMTFSEAPLDDYKFPPDDVFKKLAPYVRMTAAPAAAKSR